MSFLNVGKTVIEVTKTTMFRMLTDSWHEPLFILRTVQKLAPIRCPLPCPPHLKVARSLSSPVWRPRWRTETTSRRGRRGA